MKNAQRIIELANANGQTAQSLIIRESNTIAPLFENAGQVIELANANGQTAQSLIIRESNTIAPLFENAGQVIELANVNGQAAQSLITEKSNTIAPLFENAGQVIELANAYGQAAVSLIKLAPQTVTPLFFTIKDELPLSLVELAKTDDNAANMILKLIPEGDFSNMQTYQDNLAEYKIMVEKERLEREKEEEKNRGGRKHGFFDNSADPMDVDKDTNEMGLGLTSIAWVKHS